MQQGWPDIVTGTTTAPISLNPDWYHEIDWSKHNVELQSERRQAEQQKEKTSVRGLFQAFVIDVAKGAILQECTIIADDEDSAKLRVMHAAVCRADGAPYMLNLEDTDIIVRRIADVRTKR